MPSPLTTTMLENFIKQYNPAYNLGLGALYISICNSEGIAQDIAFCQMLVETDNVIRAENVQKMNPGGIAAVGSSGLHTFASWSDGVIGHVQHLLRYATTRNNTLGLKDPRWNFVTPGIAPTIGQLEGAYTNQLGYANAIRNKMTELYKFAGFVNPVFIN